MKRAFDDMEAALSPTPVTPIAIEEEPAAPDLALWVPAVPPSPLPDLYRLGETSDDLAEGTPAPPSSPDLFNDPEAISAEPSIGEAKPADVEMIGDPFQTEQPA